MYILNENWGKRVVTSVQVNEYKNRKKKSALTGLLSSAFIGGVQQVEGDGHGTK